MKRTKRVLFWMAVAVALAVIVGLALRPRPVLVDLATVEQGSMRVTVDEDGVTRIRERYVVSSPLMGRLQRITLEVGDEVQAEQTVLARMESTDPSLLDPRVFAQAQARVRAAEQNLEAAKAELKRAEAGVDFAENEMGRIRKLEQDGAASQSELDQSELAFRQATEDARAAGFRVDIAQYELELQRAALLLTDPDQPRDTSMELPIKAPIDGRVLRINQESTAVVQAGEPLLEVGDPTDLEVVADVLSRDAVRIEADDPVLLEQWGGDDTLSGRVRLVEPSGFTKLSALGVEEQRVNVIIELLGDPAERRLLGDNFRVDCQIIIWERSQVNRVPTSSLFRVDGRWHVFRVEQGKAVLTPVTIGHDNGQQAEMLEGPPVGTPLIVHPSDMIEAGVAVAARES
jgi:HlyD family secretion protein